MYTSACFVNEAVTYIQKIQQKTVLNAYYQTSWPLPIERLVYHNFASVERLKPIISLLIG